MNVKRMPIKEFREFGFLQEVNRQFFHPIGLALEVLVDEDGNEYLGGVWDCRDDPEGIKFDKIDIEKMNRVREFQVKRWGIRYDVLGYLYQEGETVSE